VRSAKARNQSIIQSWKKAAFFAKTYIDLKFFPPDFKAFQIIVGKREFRYRAYSTITFMTKT
jgi:hypothetical protein